LKNLLLKIEYQGSHYKGWQRQPRVSTVEETISDALRQICQQPVTIYGCSRTDSGVHARGQVATVKVPDTVRLPKLFRSLNSILPGDISVVDMVRVPLDYSVQKRNIGKRYTYQILNSPIQKALYRDFFWWIKKPLDISVMQKTSQCLLGTKDFSAFRGSGCQQKNPVKTIHQIHITRDREPPFTIIRIQFCGSGFLRNMIRIMVGTLVEISSGRMEKDGVISALQTGRRTDAGGTAPAKGLILDEIQFNPDPFTEYRSESWESDE